MLFNTTQNFHGNYKYFTEKFISLINLKLHFFELYGPSSTSRRCLVIWLLTPVSWLSYGCFSLLHYLSYCYFCVSHECHMVAYDCHTVHSVFVFIAYFTFSVTWRSHGYFLLSRHQEISLPYNSHCHDV